MSLKIEYEVLEGLRPHPNLRILNISFYGGVGFPSWVGESSFVRLTELTLRGCISCTYLPTLGHLKSLKKLFVKSMNEVKTLGMELLTTTHSSHDIAFPSLEVLKFQDMLGLARWSTSGGDKNDTIGSFPRLCEIFIVNCPKLVDVSVVLIPSVRVLYIKGCSEEVVRSMVGVSSSIKTLTLDNIKGLSQLDGGVLKHLGAVEDLNIIDCDELRYLWESESEFLASLRKLKVRSCKKLVSLGEKVEVNSQKSMQLVREVILCGCESLESYSCPNSIERLEIQYCPSITSLTFPTVVQDHLPSTLKFLRIGRCEKLEESWLLNNYLLSLESLIIKGCANLRSFPDGCFVHLTELEIYYCDNIESIPERGFGFLPLRCLGIINCKNLKSFPHEHLQSLTSLEELQIRDCPNIDYSFPRGVWPPNLRSLKTGCLNKAMSEWGVQNYPTSLVKLELYGQDSVVVSFAEAEEDGTSSSSSSSTFILPPSLLSLDLLGFENLESISEGLQHLKGLEQLTILGCNKVKDLPEKLLPSLSSLTVRGCPKLEKKCGRGKGKYWPVISQIPHVFIGDDIYGYFLSPWRIPN